VGAENRVWHTPKIQNNSGASVLVRRTGMEAGAYGSLGPRFAHGSQDILTPHELAKNSRVERGRVASFGAKTALVLGLQAVGPIWPRQQKGYVYRRCSGWFVRYCDDVMQPDGTIKCKPVSKRLPVDYGGDYSTVKSVQLFVKQALAPLNCGLLNPQATMLVSEFVEKIYLPKYVEKKLRAASFKQYSGVYHNHLKPRLGKLTLRSFRTVHGEQMLAQIAEQAKLGRSSLRHCEAFLSGAFKQVKRLGILDGLNRYKTRQYRTYQRQSRTPTPTGLSEIKSMLAVLPDHVRTIVLTAAFTGLRKCELRGLTWEARSPGRGRSELKTTKDES